MGQFELGCCVLGVLLILLHPLLVSSALLSVRFDPQAERNLAAHRTDVYRTRDDLLMPNPLIARRGKPFSVVVRVEAIEDDGRRLPAQERFLGLRFPLSCPSPSLLKLTRLGCG